MRLKKLTHDFSKYNTYKNEQKNVLNDIISKINRISDFFDAIAEFEKFIIEEIKTDYMVLIDIRQRRAEIEEREGKYSYLNNHFLPTMSTLNDKIDLAMRNWNIVEKEFTVNKMKSFIIALKNFVTELNVLDAIEFGDKTSLTATITDIIESFDKFKVYKAIISGDIVTRATTLISMQRDIIEYNKKTEEKRKTLDDI